MHPSQPPYGGPPPYPPAGPPGPPPYRGAGRPPRGRGPLLAVAGLAAVVLAGGGIAAAVLLNGSGSRGRFTTEPRACSLLTLAQVGAYMPGATTGSDSGTTCSWDTRSDATRAVRLMVDVEVMAHDTGGGPTEDDAIRQLGIRRRQADAPGTTIRPLRLGDEGFLACRTLSVHNQCLAYVRVSNAVFSVDYEGVAGADAAGPTAALAAQAVRNLPPH